MSLETPDDLDWTLLRGGRYGSLVWSALLLPGLCLTGMVRCPLAQEVLSGSTGQSAGNRQLRFSSHASVLFLVDVCVNQSYDPP